MPKPTVAVLGGTGFLGGSLVEVLRLTDEFELSAMTRSDEKVKTLEKLGVKPLQADLDDVDTLTEIAASHDVVINAASSDHMPSIQATLDGMQKRIDEGKRTVYIHTSGTGVICDDAAGMHSSDLVYSDDDFDHFEKNVVDGSIHRKFDQNIQKHAKKWTESGKNAHVRIMIPPTIYGRGIGSFKPVSAQIPNLISGSMAEGYAGMQGEGKTTNTFIKVDDLAQGFLTVLRGLLKDGSPEGKNAADIYVFCESGETYEWRQASEKIGQELKKRGVIQDATPKAFPEDKLYEHALSFDKKAWEGTRDYLSIGGNTRCKAVKLRQMGWQPKISSVDDLMKSIEDDVDYLVKQQK